MRAYRPRRFVNAALLAASVASCALSAVWWDASPLAGLFAVVALLVYSIYYTPWNGREILTTTKLSRANTLSNTIIFGAFLALAVACGLVYPDGSHVWLSVTLLAWAVVKMACEAWYAVTGRSIAARLTELFA